MVRQTDLYNIPYFGNKLRGSKRMRFIYVDEAGISANESVSIVVGIIIDADSQWRPADEKVKQIIDAAVPECFKKSFIFHAKTIWNSKEYREKWSMGDRLALLNSMMSIPRQLRLPIALGIAHRRESINIKLSHNVRKEAMQHAIAFHRCISKADGYMRRYLSNEEIATIVAENITHNRKLFMNAIEAIQTWPITMSMDILKITPGDILNRLEPEWTISRIIDTVHFTEKRYAPLLQIADACAFGIRRYFSNQSFGIDFVQSIVGKSIDINEYSCPFPGAVFFETD